MLPLFSVLQLCVYPQSFEFSPFSPPWQLLVCFLQSAFSCLSSFFQITSLFYTTIPYFTTDYNSTKAYAINLSNKNGILQQSY